jgi:hypothetical protein
MAVQWVSTSGKSTDQDVTTGSGGTVTGTVRVVYNGQDSTDDIVTAIKRAIEYFATKV